MESQQEINLKATGVLYIVATPIGNLGDITTRAITVLESVDWIAAEDTRHSKHLLQHFGITTPLISLHDFNERNRSHELLQKLQQGENIALISDAGTPLISDPGYYLVKLMREENITVTPIPGASAIITALSAGAIATDKFSFEGFLPAKSKKRLDVLSSLQTEMRTMVFYESPHRLTASLTDMQTVFGQERKLTIARELTKKFEQFITDNIKNCLEYFNQNTSKVRGEFVLIIEGAIKQEDTSFIEQDRLIDILLEQNLPVKQISQIVANYFKIKRKPIYEKILNLKE